VVLLNILYGFIMALVYSIGVMVWQQTLNFNEGIFILMWGMWTMGHIIYDVLSHWLVDYFNRDKVYTGPLR
jgi:hypothetical protein